MFLIVLSGQIEQKLTENVEVQLFLADTITNQNVENIKSQLTKNNYVAGVKYKSPSEAKEDFVRMTGEDFTDVLELNPLPASIAVKFRRNDLLSTDLSQIIGDFKQIRGVTDVGYDFDYIFDLLNYINSIKYTIYIFSIFLIIASFYLSFTLNKFIIYSKQDHYNTMKLVGAKLNTIKFPLILSGIILGILSGIISAVLVYLLFTFVQSLQIGISFTKYLYIVILINLILGLLFGLFSSLLSVRKISLHLA
jgi:cell division transport system permease protein